MKRIIKSPVTYAVLGILAVILLLTVGIGSTRAAFSEISNDLQVRVSMNDIGLTLYENDRAIAFRDYDSSLADGTWNKSEFPGVLLQDLPENVVLEQKYPEKLEVENSGTIEEFVRVTIYRYWLDKDGKAITTLEPDLIQLEFDNQDLWIRDASSDTKERIVLYYKPLLAAGERSVPFLKSISISNKIATKVTKTVTNEGTTIKTTYDYDGVQFVLEISSDAVQGHNAQDAIKSAWGPSISVEGNSLNLN